MIYSIGYSTRTLPEFLNELDRRNITQLWDVRSRPRSRNWPFNASQIEVWADKAGILYRQCGAVLGGSSGVPIDDARYTFRLEQMVRIGASENLVIMCTEGDPARCHRSYAVGLALFYQFNVSLRSILRSGSEERFEATLKRVPRSFLKQEIVVKNVPNPGDFSLF